MNTKILIIYTNSDPATELSILFFERFSKHIGAMLSVKCMKDIKRNDVDSCDVLVSIRTQNYCEVSIIQYAKRQGKMYGLVLDDDFLAIPNYKTRRFVQYCALTKCIKYADVLFCTNESLGNKLQRLSLQGKYVRTDTTVNVEEISAYKNVRDDIIKIVYYVNDGSLYSYNAIVKPLIDKLRLRIDINIEWHFIGIKPELNAEIKKNVHLYDHMSLQDFKRTLAESGFTFGIAPLLDNEFNNGKYVNKFIEFTCAGLPCIYSNVEPYSSFIRNNIDGILVDNNSEWIKAIIGMRDQSIRKKIVNNAQSRILKEMSCEAVFERIIEQFPSIKEFKCNRKAATMIDKCVWLYHRVWGRSIMITDLMFRIRGRLKCEGFKSLVTYSLQRLGNGGQRDE